MEDVHNEGDVMLEERSVVPEGMVPVCWPVTYGSLSTGHLLSEGMILGVRASGFQIAGTTPVEVGMRLHLWVTPPAKPARLFLRATVMWVKEHEFGLDILSVGVEDQQRLLDVLAEAHNQLLPQTA